jgi:DNA repair exonuclease SbcCD ATPase subunit
VAVRTRLSQGVRNRQDELGKAETALEQERQEVAELESSLRTALDRRPSLADDPAGFAENETAVSSFQAELLRRREYVLPRREDDLIEARSKLAHAEWDQAGKALVGAQKQRHEASVKVAGKLSELRVALDALMKVRASVEELEAEFRARVPSGASDWTFPAESRDEPTWPEQGDLLEVVSAGPKRPLAQEAAAVECAERENETRSRAVIADAVEDAVVRGSFGKLEQLPRAHLAAALGVAERRAEEEIAQRERALADPDIQTGTGEKTRALIARLEERVERIRELAGDVVAA